MGGIVSAVGNVVGGVIGKNAATSAGRQEKAYTNAANQKLTDYYDTATSKLDPYANLGKQGTDELSARLPELTKPITMDQATLEATPGYQFTKDQGLRATQNAAAARGLGVSGAALKGAANYASGLADSTYQNQFNNAVTNQNNIYNRLAGVTGLGESAAKTQGDYAQTTGNELSNNLTGLGNAIAGSKLAAGKALGAGVQGGFNTLGASMMGEPIGSSGEQSAAGVAQSSSPGNPFMQFIQGL